MVMASIARTRTAAGHQSGAVRPAAAAERPWRMVVEEVAEAPGEQPRRIERRPNTVARIK